MAKSAPSVSVNFRITINSLVIVEAADQAR
jgi:hypothetical protein